jgi:hypothetical protein
VQKKLMKWPTKFLIDDLSLILYWKFLYFFLYYQWLILNILQHRLFLSFLKIIFCWQVKVFCWRYSKLFLRCIFLVIFQFNLLSQKFVPIFSEIMAIFSFPGNSHLWQVYNEGIEYSLTANNHQLYCLFCFFP